MSSEQAVALVAELRASKRKDDALVLVALRGGMVDGRWFANYAEAAVGDIYATGGRTRSQAIARARRRGIDRGLLIDSHRYPFNRTDLGREVALLLAAETAET